MTNDDCSIKELLEMIKESPDYITEDNVVRVLESLPKEYRREYELQIDCIVKLEQNNKMEDLFKRILEDDSTNRSDDVRYASFYSLCTIYRRKRYYSEYYKIFNIYKREFENKKTINHLESMCLRELSDEMYLKRAIEKAIEAKNDLVEHIGVLHSYAVMIAMGFEEDIYTVENNANKKELQDALEITKDIIQVEGGYAKFYATRGRLLGINGDFKEAKKMIKEAIDKEDKNTSGYSLRMLDYQSYLYNVNVYKDKKELQETRSNLEKDLKELEDSMAESSNKLEIKMKQSSEKLEKEKTSNLEFLGFFTAILSFTIGSLQITGQQSLSDAKSLIIILVGSLLIVLGGFGTILHGNEKLLRNITTFVMGFIMITLGIFVI